MDKSKLRKRRWGDERQSLTTELGFANLGETCEQCKTFGGKGWKNNWRGTKSVE